MSATPKMDRAPATAAEVLDVVDRLIGSAVALDPVAVRAALGVAIERRPEGDTPTIEAWATSDANAWAVVDLRMPAADFGSSSVLLSTTIQGIVELDLVELGQRFGRDYTTEPPSPRFARGSVPTYLVYQKPWGALSLGVTARPSPTLLSFVIEVRPHAEGEA